MILKGKTVQEGSPSPDTPVEIKNTVLVEFNRKGTNKKEVIELDLEKFGLKEGEYLIEKNGKWYVHPREEER